MTWKHPHISKIYEALSTIADNRMEITGNTAKSFSTSRNKFYEIEYDPIANQIMCNDNSSYFKGELGYPAIAFLMKVEKLSFDQKIADLLKGILWKDINQKFKNNFDKAVESVMIEKTEKDRKVIEEFVRKVDKEITELNIGMLGKNKFPPAGY